MAEGIIEMAVENALEVEDGLAFAGGEVRMDKVACRGELLPSLFRVSRRMHVVVNS